MRVALEHGLDGGVADVLGRVEVRFAEAEVEDVVAFRLQLPGLAPAASVADGCTAAAIFEIGIILVITSEVRNQKSEIRSQKSGIRNQESDLARILYTCHYDCLA